MKQQLIIQHPHAHTPPSHMYMYIHGVCYSLIPISLTCIQYNISSLYCSIVRSQSTSGGKTYQLHYALIIIFYVNYNTGAAPVSNSIYVDFYGWICDHMDASLKYDLHFQMLITKILVSFTKCPAYSSAQ